MDWKLICVFPLLFLSGIHSLSIISYGVLGKQKEIISLLRQIHTGHKYCHDYYPHLHNVGIEIGGVEIFSIFNGDHLVDVKKLYTFFMSATAYEDFYERSAWAKCNVNEDLFLYTFSVAFLRNPFTKDVVLPNFYEINPYYFVEKGAIKQATEAKENNTLIKIPVNIDDITYFTKDVGVSSYYYFINILLPFWIEHDDGFPLMNRNGHFYLYLHQQLLARYNLERYALGLKPTQSYDYEHPIELGYDNDLVYPDGRLFPSRNKNEDILRKDVLEVESSNNTNSNAYTYMKDYELEMRQLLNGPKNYDLSVEMGLIGSRPGQSGKFNYPRITLANRDEYSTTPSVLEHYETSLRDPMFWPMLKRMLYPYYKYSNINNRNINNRNINKLFNLYNQYEAEAEASAYEDEDEDEDSRAIILNFKISRLETYFEDYIIDLSNTNNFSTQATMQRLNHIPFDYEIEINSIRPQVLIKIFIGPKSNKTIKHNRFNFVEIDRFVQKTPYRPLNIERNSYSINYYSHDRIKFTDAYNNIIDGFIHGVSYNANNSLKYYGFPKRLILPKGSKHGTSFLLYVVALPYEGNKDEYIYNMDYVDFFSPFNVPLNDEEYLRNAFMKEVQIYHSD